MNYPLYLGSLYAMSDNPIHRQHVEEFHELVRLMIEDLVPPIVEREMEKYLTESKDEKLRPQIEEVVQQQQEKHEVDVQAYFNRKPVTDANIIRGVKDMVTKALRKIGKGR